MAMDEYLRAKQQRLALYRHTIEFLLAQREQDGALAYADLDRQLDDVRQEIQAIKHELRTHGVAVEDHGSDDGQELGLPSSGAPPTNQDILPLQYQQIFNERLRSLTLTGVSGLDDLHLPLADVYVERTLRLNDPIATANGAADQPPTAPTLADLLSAPASRVLLEGDPGSGKTTCMRRVALACATALSGRPGPGAEPLIGWVGPVPLPIFLWMHALDAVFADLEFSYEDASIAAVPRLWIALEAWLRQLDLSALIPIVRHALDQGHCLVLIDGLDDLLGPQSQQRVASALNEFIAYYASNRFVVAAHGLERGVPIDLDTFDRYTLVPLDRARIDELIERWYQALASAAALSLPTDVSERIAHLQGLLHGDELIAELSTSPLLLVLWILTHAESHRLPAARGIIRMRECDLLLNGWGHDSLTSTPFLQQIFGFDLGDSSAQSLSLLQPLALVLLSRRAPKSDAWPTISGAEATQLLESPVVALGVEPRHAHEQVIPSLIQWFCSHNLLAEITPGRYTMPRRPLCEYLAAQALAALPDFSDRARALRHDPRWREALSLVAYELAQGPEPERVYDLVQSLLWPSVSGAGSDTHDLLLAAECLTTISQPPQSKQPLRNELRRRLVTLLADQRLTVEERVHAGRLLGLLGDPRFEDLRPPLVTIAAGPFWLGSQGQYDDEGPAHRVDLPAFAIGIYPVTNQEYAAFLKDSGYPPPRYWYDSRFNNPSCPVVGVTWHDACKYCAWLQNRLDQAGLLPRNTIVRLPLEAEWEKAASWDSQRKAKRRYPWGDEWSNTRANIVRGRGAWMTSPVGCYPEGVSAAGLHDCIGNVWEWTASVYRNYPGAATTFHETGSYTLRGSSCMSMPTHARCSYRSRLPADYWRYHLGFRIVLARPLSGLALP